MLNRIPIFVFIYSELKEGIALTDEDNNSLDCQSKTAAVQGISSVVLSRIGMACPGMGKFYFSFFEMLSFYQSAGFSFDSIRCTILNQQRIFQASSLGKYSNSTWIGWCHSHFCYAIGLCTVQPDSKYKRKFGHEKN